MTMPRPFLVVFFPLFATSPWGVFLPRGRIGSRLFVSSTLPSEASGAPYPVERGDRDLEDLSRREAHHANPGFLNPWLPGVQPVSVARLLQWLFSPNPYARAKRRPLAFSVVPPRVEEIQRRGDSVTYLGHASFWIRLAGQNIFTDPVFGDVWPRYRRRLPFPLPPENLPFPEIVLISHNHYDHLDKASLRRLGTVPLYLTPLKHRDWFRRHLPGARVMELDWFESFAEGAISFRLLPSQHWSMRNPWDTNRRLWGAWLIQGGKRSVFFCGDSGYFYGFQEYGRKFGPLDVAILPIGAYEPRWFMKDHHMNPQEAIMAFFDLRAEVMIPQQWGVFDLTDEPLDLPPRAYREASQAAGLPEHRTPLLLPGQTWFFPENRSDRLDSGSTE
jgi:N-acyl-phosphatidylethanolamine-hydrolysing phospholipase D